MITLTGDDLKRVKRIRIVLDTGEDIKISDPVSMCDTGAYMGFEYKCVYYDISGEHQVLKSIAINASHVVYINLEYKED